MSFFGKIKLFIKKIAIYFLVISFISSIFYTVRLYKKKQKRIEFSAIIDTDSGNGVSDLFVIARALSDPKFEVIGLTSVQWNQHPNAIGSTVESSQAVNDTLLMLFNREEIPHPRGAEKMISYLNYPIFQFSDAAEFIVEKARQATKQKKLNIITLGALTNVATAILIDSTIVPKIRIYASVMYYDPDKKVWNKNEFNARNDLDALDLILNKKDLEIHIMPLSSSGVFYPDLSETSDLMRNKGRQWNYILNKLEVTSQGRKVPVDWNIALIEAILKPDDIREDLTYTPPENLKRQVNVYSWVNKEFMKIDYHDIIKKYIADQR